MSDYIKRENAIKWLKNLFDDCGNYMSLWHYGEVLPKIIELLEVDVAPVRHGEWIHPREYGLNMPEHYCSECEAWEYSDTESNYCPHCGARMNEEANDGQDDSDRQSD